MKVSVLGFISLFALAGVCFGQKPQTFLLKRFETPVAFDALQEYSTLAARYREAEADKNKPNILIRFCTKEPLRDSIDHGAIAWKSLSGVFLSYGFSSDRSFVVRDANCAKGKLSVIPTELWLVYNDEGLPSFQEKYTFAEIATWSVDDSAQEVDSAKTLRSSIVPLETTRAMVEKLLGSPIAGDDIYDTPKFRITIWYSGKSKRLSCNWGVPDGTVIRVLVTPKKRPPLSELGFDMSAFKKLRTEDDEVWDYVDESKGITVETHKPIAEASEEQVIFFDYSAPQKELNKRCPN